MKRIYLAGPMTGYPEHNFPAFRRETKRLRDLGYDVVSPEEINGHLHQQLPYIQYLRRDVAQLATCDTIAFLDGWEKSVGARKEEAVGIILEMTLVLSKNILKPDMDYMAW